MVDRGLFSSPGALWSAPTRRDSKVAISRQNIDLVGFDMGFMSTLPVGDILETPEPSSIRVRKHYPEPAGRRTEARGCRKVQDP